MKRDDIVKVMLWLGFSKSAIKESDTWVSASCPFAKWTHAKRADRSASFGISVNDEGPSGYNCLGCGEHGTVRGLVGALDEHTGEDHSELLDEIAELETPTTLPPWESIRERATVSHKISDPINESLFDSIFPSATKSKMAKSYFKSRGLFLDSMLKFDLRWDGYRKRILFKVKQDGILYGCSGRAVNPAAKNKVRIYNHPKSLFLVGEEFLDLQDLAKPIVVIEGLMGLAELDALSLYDYADAIALQGASLSNDQRDRLVDTGKPIVLLFDNDQAGREGLHGKTLSKGRRKAGAVDMLSGLCELSVAKWPEGADDFLELTRRELKQMVMETWSF